MWLSLLTAIIISLLFVMLFPQGLVRYFTAGVSGSPPHTNLADESVDSYDNVAPVRTSLSGRRSDWAQDTSRSSTGAAVGVGSSSDAEQTSGHAESEWINDLRVENSITYRLSNLDAVISAAH